MTPTLVHTTVTTPGVVVPLLGGAVLLLLAMAGTVVAPKGEYRLVARHGVVRRVVASGLGWRVPGLDTVAALPATAHEQPLLVRATTRDGADVVVLAEATVRFCPPEPGAPCGDPWRAAEAAAEQAVRARVAPLTLAQLGTALRVAARWLEDDVLRGWAAEGVDLLDLVLVEVDLPLSGGRPGLGRPDR